jgi:hypothetical protein
MGVGRTKKKRKKTRVWSLHPHRLPVRLATVCRSAPSVEPMHFA